MRRMTVSAAAGAVLASAAVLWGTPASAATGYPWSAQYGTASASGTWSYTSSGVLSGNLKVTGVLTGQGPGCYVVQLIVSEDLVPVWRTSDPQCGSGSTPVDLSLYLSTMLWSGNVAVCRADDTSDCGPQVPLVRG